MNIKSNMSSSKIIDLSVIIVVLNDKHIVGCLKSVKNALNGVSAEIIIVDNSLDLKVGKSIKQIYPDIKLIVNSKKAGFGENNNIGLKVARGRYVLLLNDDTEIINNNIFKDMVSWMDEHSGVGISSCALLNPDRKTIQGSGGYFPTLFKVFAWMSFLDDIPGLDKIIKPFHPMHADSPINKGSEYFNKPHKQDWVTGAYLLMRKSALEEAGNFDEDFFMYVEEVDLAYRFAEKGWETWYLPQWNIIHFGMSTTGSENAIIFELQNLNVFYKKHFAYWQQLMALIIIRAGILLRIIVFGVLKPETVKTYVKAFSSV